MTEKEIASNDIRRKIVSEEDKSTGSEDDVSGRKRRLQLTLMKQMAWYTTAEDHGVQTARMWVEVVGEEL